MPAPALAKFLADPAGNVGRDLRDFHAHPEWFTVRPVAAPHSDLIREVFALGSVEARDEMIARIVNPPVVITRKPVPFVLPIKGTIR